jgi:hypothetical protein
MDCFGNGFLALIAEDRSQPYRCPINTTMGARFFIDGMTETDHITDDALRLFGLIAS